MIDGLLTGLPQIQNDVQGKLETKKLGAPVNADSEESTLARMPFEEAMISIQKEGESLGKEKADLDAESSKQEPLLPIYSTESMERVAPTPQKVVEKSEPLSLESIFESPSKRAKQAKQGLAQVSGRGLDLDNPSIQENAFGKEIHSELKQGQTKTQEKSEAMPPEVSRVELKRGEQNTPLQENSQIQKQPFSKQNIETPLVSQLHAAQQFSKSRQAEPVPARGEVLTSVLGSLPESAHTDSLLSPKSVLPASSVFEMSARPESTKSAVKLPAMDTAMNQITAEDFINAKENVQEPVQVARPIKMSDGPPLPTSNFSSSAEMPTIDLSNLSPIQNQPVKSVPKVEVTGAVVQGAGAKNRFSSVALIGISKGIQDLSSKGGGEMRIRLKPENLGELHLKVSTQGNQVALKVQTAGEQAQKIIEDSIGYLKENLKGQSLLLSKVDLGLITNTPIHNIESDQGSLLTSSSWDEEGLEQNASRGFSQGERDSDSVGSETHSDGSRAKGEASSKTQVPAGVLTRGSVGTPGRIDIRA